MHLIVSYLSPLLIQSWLKSAVKRGLVGVVGIRDYKIDYKKFHTNFIMSANDGQVLRFSKLSNKAFAPMKATEYAAGYDLRSAYEYIILGHGKELVKTDLQIEVPHGTYGRVAPRSGLAWKNHIDVGAGVIDADYRGNVGVVLFNHSDENFKILPGDRIAQLICEKITYPKLEEVETLSNTNRGADGFGSTGTK